MSKLIIKNRYSVIPNDLVNNPEISLRAKGLFAFIQSKPDGWDFSADRISNQTKEGLQAVISALKELEKSGYLLRERFQNEQGHWGVNYLLKENPTIENPTIGNPPIGNPGIGKAPNNIKKETTKKEVVKNKEFEDFFGAKNQYQEPIYSVFDNERNEIFKKWFKYKREKKSKYTQTGIETLLNAWYNKSNIELAQAVDHSIANNYQGLFEPKKNNLTPGSKDSKNSTTLQDKPIIPIEWQ
jgi:hypothetical protein